MTKNRKLKVFLCHSKDDKPQVRELYRRLVANGFEAWLDEEKLVPGQEWDLEIRKAVRESDVVVVCLSSGAVTKTGYVQKEIRFALDVADEQPEGGVFIIPARLEDCQVPMRLSKWQWVDLFEEHGNDKLLSSLNLRAPRLGIFADLPSDFEPPMVKIPAGKFLMGSTKEQIAGTVTDDSNKAWFQNEIPQHALELSEYFIGKYPITNREYQAFVRNTRYNPPRGWDGDQFPVDKGEHPVVNVSWNDAMAYCNWLSERTRKQYCLPTEAEWEKAARGEMGLIFPWGNEVHNTWANTKEAKIGGTSEVGKFSPHGDSPYGCADMIGNVWEWTSSLWGKYWNSLDFRYPYDFKDGREDPDVGQEFIRILRGGSFFDDPWFARCAVRLRRYPNYLNIDFGFRVALSLSK